MERRDVLKAAALTATTAATLGGIVAGGVTAAAAHDGEGVAVVDIPPLDPACFVPDGFAGKTMIVTGSARGMGAAAAIRAVREGANVVAVDIMGDLGQSVVDAIVAEGGKAVFVAGDIAEEDTSTRMIAAAVDPYGGLDLAWRSTTPG